MRGLKPVTNKTIGIDKLSHLLQMRGLKLSRTGEIDAASMSHLLQMRGLKHRLWKVIWLHNVASFTDAWIETQENRLNLIAGIVASFTDAWIETYRWDQCYLI